MKPVAAATPTRGVEPASAKTQEVVPARPVDRPPADSAVRENRAASEKDWGLASAERPGSILRKLVVAGLGLTLAGGGYYGYSRYLAPKAETIDSEIAAANAAEGTPEAQVDAADDVPEMRDPFGDGDAETSSVPRRRGANSRVASHNRDAEKKILRVPGMSFPPRARKAIDEAQSSFDEPQDDGFDQTGPKLVAVESLPRLKPPPTARSGRMPFHDSANRLNANDSSTADDEDFEDDANDEVYPAGGGRKPSGPSISNVEVQDEQNFADDLEDFEPIDEQQPRASSQTVIVRSASASVDDDGWTVDEDDRPLLKSADETDQLRDDSASDIKPRSTPSARAETKVTSRTNASGVAGRKRPANESGSAGTVSHSEVYTIAPSDNFWTISKKQYGTSRYFAALARHNQDRVADPQRLRPGMQVATPTAAVLEQRYPELIEKSGTGTTAARPRTPTAEGRPAFEKPLFGSAAVEKESGATSAPNGYFYSKSGDPMYRVGGDDTLGSIAQRHLGRASRWIEIYESNRDTLKNPESLTVGSIIRLPPDASKVGWLDSESQRRR